MALPAQTLEKPRIRRIYYPTSDGKPMAETDTHRDLGIYGIEALKARYADQPDVYISGNNFIFYQEGDPRKRISPDVYVVFGVKMRQRDSYKAWEEGDRLPDVVFEFTSRKTQKEDVETKVPLYEQVLRVREYFQFDPTGDYLKPPLQGRRLIDGRYAEIELIDGRMYSAVLGLELVIEGQTLRFFDPAKLEWLLTPLEQAQRAEEQAQRAEFAEAEIARLRAEIETLKRSSDR
jgi:Uma2 family endonuclease